MGDKGFEIEKILGERVSKEYLVKWANHEEKTWEPERLVSHLKGVVADWEKRKESEVGQSSCSSQFNVDTSGTKKITNGGKRKSEDDKAGPSKRATTATKLTPVVNVSKQETASSSKESMGALDQDEMSVLLRSRLRQCADLFLEDVEKNRENVVDKSNKEDACLEQEKRKRILEKKIKDLEDERSELFHELKSLKVEMKTDADNKKAREDEAAARDKRLLKEMHTMFTHITGHSRESQHPVAMESMIPRVYRKLADMIYKARQYDSERGQLD